MTVVYCNRCGCENPVDRGACLACLNLLRWPPAGNACPSCGGDNASEAQFCASCGGPMGEAPARALSVAAAVNLVLGEATEEQPVEEEDYVGEAEAAEPAAVPDLDFEAPGQPEEVIEPAVAEPEPFEPVTPLTEEIEAPEAAPPPPPEEAAELVPEFEELAIELEAEEKAEEPAPPPDAITLDEEPSEESELGGWSIEQKEEDEESGQ